MSRVVDMVGALWAAVWVRWELMRARRARRAAGRDRADDSLVLAMMAVPVEGVDYEPLELDADLRRRLETTAADLLSAAPAVAERGASRRRPLRAAAATAGAVLAVIAVAASASALIAGTTGVPAMDRLLGIWESGLDRDTVPDRPGLTPEDVRPSSAGPTLAYDVQDGPSGTATSFIGASRRICMVHSFDRGTTGAPVCESPTSLGRALAADGLQAFQLDVRPAGVAIVGQVEDGVDEIRVNGPMGAMTVVLGEAWKPSGTGIGPIRPFAAVAPLGGVGSEMKRGSAASALSEYSFVVRAADGSTRTVTPK